MTKIIGLTGGIGSGKTTIANLFAAAGIPVYIADDEAKKIMQKPETIALIAAVFGSEILIDGLIQKKKLAELVFKNPEKLKQLNKIIHPLVKKDFDNWMLKNSTKFIIKETAILFESGSYKYCDKIITVTAAEETRINRVLLRDNCTREQVLERIKNQLPEDFKISKSDFVIVNENLEEAKLQFYKILKILQDL